MRIARRLNLCTIFLLIITVSAAAVPADASQTRAVSAGSFHTIILDSNGTVWAWGADMLGQCGDNHASSDSRTHFAPVQAEVSGIKDISAGSVFTLALKDDGTVWAWGANTWGQLGMRLDAAHPLPAAVPGLSNITAISAGSEFSLALKDDGTVWAWGHNGWGQLGDAIPYNQSFSNNTQDGYYSPPAPKSPGIDIVGHVDNVSEYLEKAYRERATIGPDASRDGAQNASSWYLAHNSTPGKVAGISDIRYISAYDSNALAVDGAGTIWAWGSYRLNMSTLNGFSTPAKFGVLKNVTAVSRNGFLTSDGRVYVLTLNSGKLTRDPQCVPYDLVEVPGLANITKISFGRGHYAALKDDGTVWTWGYNEHGELGDGTSKGRTAPMNVYGLSDITNIASGEAYTIAVSGDGTIWGWGLDADGQLGDGDSGYGVHKKLPVAAQFTSDMRPKTANVTPIPEAGGPHGAGVSTPSPAGSNVLSHIISSLSNNYLLISLTILTFFVCCALIIKLRGKK